MKFDKYLCSTLHLGLMIFSVLALSGFGMSAVEAKTLKAKSGENIHVGVIGSYSLENCSTLLTNGAVKGSARNGKVSAKWVRHTITGGSCKGRSLKVIVVRYQSNKGYKGRDTVTVNYHGPRGSRYKESSVNGPVARKFNIQVK